MLKTIDGEVLNVPEHVAIILDGNGRWAKKKLRPRTFGHKRGAEVLEQICEDAWDIGIKYLTVYAFSTENWKRPQDEVDTLMDLFHNYLVNYLGRIMKNNMRIRFIGDRSGLSEKMQEEIYDMERESVYNTGLNFTIALNYGSRDEIVRAVTKLADDARSGKLPEGRVTEEVFASYLDTADIPDPDLLIRTSGEQRLSNFLLWQLAYTEFYFTPVPWPAFGIKELEDAIAAYNGRDRRFGGV